MKAINTEKRVNGDTEYSLSCGWGGEEDFRLGIASKSSCFDVFLSFEEIEILYELLGQKILENNHMKREYLLDYSGIVGSCQIILEWIERENILNFTQRQLHYKFKSRIKKVEHLYPCINYLKEENYISELPTEEVSYRPSRCFSVNAFAIQEWFMRKVENHEQIQI